MSLVNGSTVCSGTTIKEISTLMISRILIAANVGSRRIIRPPYFLSIQYLELFGNLDNDSYSTTAGENSDLYGSPKEVVYTRYNRYQHRFSCEMQHRRDGILVFSFCHSTYSAGPQQAKKISRCGFCLKRRKQCKG